MSALTPTLKTYFILTKPGIIFGNLVTAIAGFALASKGSLDFPLLLVTLAGLSLIIASACVFNNYIDRDLDEKMQRTKNRPLAKRLISTKNALVFATFLSLFGTILLALFTNLLTVVIALLGLSVYLFLYSSLKYHTSHATLIGSIAGATPPVVGYTAVSHTLDIGAFVLFAMIALWQMPHFFAIALYRLDDYAAASLPVLPIKRGVQATKIQMMSYIIAFIGASSLLTGFGYTKFPYLIVTSLLGFTWLWLCVKGFSCDNDQVWARKMFLFSLVVVVGVSIAIFWGNKYRI